MPIGNAGELAYRAVRAEVALSMRLSERTVERQLTEAFRLTRDYSPIVTAMEAGDISLQHARVILNAGNVIGLSDDAATLVRRASFIEAILPSAETQTPAALANEARRLAEQFSDVSIDERQEIAQKERRVWVDPREDGMADLIAHLPAWQAYAIRDRLARASRPLAERERKQDVGGQARRRGQIVADLFSEVLLSRRNDDSDEHCAADEMSLFASIAPIVRVTVPMAALPESDAATLEAQSDVMGVAEDLNRESAVILDGYGPISGATGRELARQSPMWDLVRVQPDTGHVVAVDRYRPSAAMQRYLRVRDQHCRFPGCQIRAERCDIDHTIDAARGGPTSIENLAHLCRGHHTLKHHTEWSVKQIGAGRLQWRSPTGRSYVSEPAIVSAAATLRARSASRVKFEAAPF